MTSPDKRFLGAIAAATALALGLGGCGQDATIERADADAAIAALDGVDRAYGDGRCEIAQQRARSLSVQIDGLPSNTDEELRRALQRSADRLARLIASQCLDQTETVEPTAPVTGATPVEPEKPKKEKKDKKGDGENNGIGPPPQEQPPAEQTPDYGDDSGGVSPGSDGTLIK